MYLLVDGSNLVCTVETCKDDLSLWHVKDLALIHQQLARKELSVYSEDGELICKFNTYDADFIIDIGSQDGIIIVNR